MPGKKLWVVDDIMENLTETFIESVRERPVLYDFKDQYYKDPAVKHNAWKQIVGQMKLENGKQLASWLAYTYTYR